MPGADPGTEIRDAARLELIRQVEAGTLGVLVAATHPLADARVTLEEFRERTGFDLGQARIWTGDPSGT